MKKYLASVACTAAVALLLCGCTYGSGVFERTTYEMITPSEMSMEYEGFTGFKQKELALEPGDVITYDLQSTDGSISIVIQNLDNEEYLLDKTTKKRISGKISVTEDAEYLIKVTGDGHSGSFSVKIDT